MKLLVCVQAVDANDSQASFFISWIEALAARFESVTVICLREGQHDLPENVRVYSLGKERATGSRLQKRAHYVRALLSLAWNLRHEHDAVFVHQNEEYLLVAGWLWRLLGKPVYLWRNHYAGSWRTRLAVCLAHRVYCTSRGSYTARFAKTKLMPIGIDTELFAAPQETVRVPHSILFLGRIASSKRPHELVEALAMLQEKGIAFSATFVGDPPPGQESYASALEEHITDLGLGYGVSIEPGVPNRQTVQEYVENDIYVNLSKTGMYDKTIFEAAACGCLVLACNRDYAEQVDERLSFREQDIHDLAAKLETLLALPSDERERLVKTLRALAEKQSLSTLMNALKEDIDV